MNRTSSCKRCGEQRGYDTIDPCLKGKIPGVLYACCGHGDVNLCYVMFTNRVSVHGKAAYQFLEEYKFQIEITKRRLKDQRGQLQRLRKSIIEGSNMSPKDKKAALESVEQWKVLLGVDTDEEK